MRGYADTRLFYGCFPLCSGQQKRYFLPKRAESTIRPVEFRVVVILSHGTFSYETARIQGFKDSRMFIFFNPLWGIEDLKQSRTVINAMKFDNISERTEREV